VHAALAFLHDREVKHAGRGRQLGAEHELVVVLVEQAAAPHDLAHAFGDRCAVLGGDGAGEGPRAPS